MEKNQTAPANVIRWSEEPKLDQKLREITASLPTKKGWLDHHFYQYQGFWYPTRFLAALLSIQKHFQARHSDVLLATSPKSGTTWMKALIFALMNRWRWCDNGGKNSLLESSPHVLVPSLEFDLYAAGEAIDDLSLSVRESPRIFSTHLPFTSLPTSLKESESKIVYMGRNPKDVLVSLWHFNKKLNPDAMNETSLEVLFDRFCEGRTAFGPVWDNLLGYWIESLKNPEKVLFLKFEEMKKDPKIETVRLVEFLGCPFSGEEERRGVVEDIVKLCSFENLSRLQINQTGELEKGVKNNSFFRKGESGDSRNYLTKEMSEQIDRITHQKLGGSGLKL